MNELSLDKFRRAIRATHGCESQLVDRVHVEEHGEGGPVWQGDVLVFALLGNNISTRCYAWEVEGGITAVLHAGPIDSAVKAVRAAMLPDSGD
jgi:hypothetical protein